MGGVADSTMRAINILNGEEVWTNPLPSSSAATPMTYVSPETNKQYVIVTVPSSGGGLTLENQVDTAADSQEGGYVIAYALPD